MISIVFAGLPISCYQDSKLSYTIAKKETVLLSGDLHSSVSTKQRSFPRSYECWTDDYQNITDLKNKIGLFDTLTVETISYTNCYISSIGSIFELARGRGSWTYEIEFSQAEAGSTISETSPIATSLETDFIYVDESLAASATLDSLPLSLTDCIDVNIYVSNTGQSENLVVDIKGSYSAEGTIKTPVFVCALNTIVVDSGGPITAPPNFLFIHVKNNDTVHSTTFSITITKHVIVE